jgi:hypothetical protein
MSYRSAITVSRRSSGALLVGLALAATTFATMPSTVLAKEDKNSGNNGEAQQAPIVASARIEHLQIVNPATTSNPSLAAAADSELLGFQTYVNQNWSALGYSSPQAMAGALGNSQTNWLANTERTAAGK